MLYLQRKKGEAIVITNGSQQTIMTVLSYSASHAVVELKRGDADQEPRVYTIYPTDSIWIEQSWSCHATLMTTQGGAKFGIKAPPHVKLSRAQ